MNQAKKAANLFRMGGLDIYNNLSRSFVLLKNENRSFMSQLANWTRPPGPADILIETARMMGISERSKQIKQALHMNKGQGLIDPCHQGCLLAVSAWISFEKLMEVQKSLSIPWILQQE
jgi:hypothetical protein